MKTADGWDLQLLPLAPCNHNSPESWQETIFTHCLSHINWTNRAKVDKVILHFCHCFEHCGTEVQAGGGGGGGRAHQHTTISQQSVEFDTQTKSSPLPLNGFHWRVKQQTNSQCDCLSNAEITTLHLTEMTWGRSTESLKHSYTDMLEPA